MLFVFAISTSACYAGGTYFPIKITNIQTILQKEHHIYFLDYKRLVLIITLIH